MNGTNSDHDPAGLAAPESARRAAPPTTGVVLAGGRLPPAWLSRGLLAGASLIVAADGGLAHAAVLGVVPDLLVGDLDSAEPALLSAYAGLETEVHPVDKDELDLELAIDAAIRRGAGEVRVLGAFGGRLDQSLASVLVGARYVRSGARVSLYGELHEAHVLVAGAAAASLRRALPEGTTVSLLALEAGTVVSASGLAYELDEADLPYGAGLGLSNRARADRRPVTVEAHAGALAVLVEHEHDAVPATTALWGTQEGRVRDALVAADPDLARLIEEFAYESVFERPGLDHRTRELIAVALLASMGATDELPTHLRAALQVGATERELREAIIHTGTYAGLPRALAAMRRLNEHLQRRRRRASSASPEGGES